jgi:hypothetical protein
MARKKSSWISQFERKVSYDRDTFITICKRHLLGEQLSAICAKPPMPVAQCVMSWVQNNEEGRGIWDCVRMFESDRALAAGLGVPMNSSVSDWADAVYDKLEHGYSLNNYERQTYIMPDWTKLYSRVGDPPVWSSENLQDYEELLKEITQRLKPRDIIELIYTKEMADSIWEDNREGREKNNVPERQYQMRLSEAHAVRVAQACQRNLPMPKPAAQEPATSLDHIRGFRTGFKTYQALDMAQARKKKRRDNAPRQIARWRNSFGGKAEVLPDRFVAELALAERDGVAHLLSDPQTDNISDESVQAGPSPVPAGKVMQADPSSVPGGGTVNSPLAHTQEVAPAATSVALPDAIARSASGGDPANAAQSVPAADQAKAQESGSLVAGTGEPTLAPTDNGPEALSPPAPVEKTAQVAPTASGETGQVAPPRVPAHEVEVKMGGMTERINFVAWLWGAKRYAWDRLETAGEKAFKRRFTSKRALVRYLVLDCNMVRPDEVGPELAPCLRGSEFPSQPLFGAAAKAASSIGASSETPGAASPLASEAGSAEVVPAERPAGVQAAPSVPGAGQTTPAPADNGAKERPPAPTRELAQAAPSIGSSARSAALPYRAADSAPPRTPAHEVEINVDGVTARINWIDWLTGAQRYPRHWVIKAGEKAFQRHFSSKCGLLRKLVLECKMIPPDQLCPELALLVSKLEPRRMPRPARWEARP